MQDNPHEWIKVLNNLPPEMAGFLMAIVISFLRVIYDQKETRPLRLILESLICGCLSLTASSAIVALHLNINWAMFAGGIIGYLGSSTIRSLALRLINREIK